MLQFNKSSILILFTSTMLLAGACSSQAPGTNPDDMSAEEHLEHAEGHQAVADEHHEEYDPDSPDQHPRFQSDLEKEYFELGIYNPTEHHRASAKRHQDEAEQHRRAAQELQSYEHEQCAKFPEETRSACPLMEQIKAVEDVDGGARLTFHEDVLFEAAEAHVQCHYAFARTVGREGMDFCPLYIEGLSISAEPDDHSVVLTTDHPEAVEALRNLSRAHQTE